MAPARTTTGSPESNRRKNSSDGMFFTKSMVEVYAATVHSAYSAMHVAWSPAW